ncbi:hypothetical protein E2542_SST13952 [Spatholobus suberectus]|nr:hypothetical protein E2542_SST13952 [Spatholobus suberectus]
MGSVVSIGAPLYFWTTKGEPNFSLNLLGKLLGGPQYINFYHLSSSCLHPLLGVLLLAVETGKGLDAGKGCHGCAGGMAPALNCAVVGSTKDKVRVYHWSWRVSSIGGVWVSLASVWWVYQVKGFVGLYWSVWIWVDFWVQVWVLVGIIMAKFG